MINSKFFITLICSPLILILIYNITGIPENKLFFFTNLLIIFISFLGMFYNQSQAYSLFKMSFIFIFIFYGIIPLLNEIRGNIIYGQWADDGSYIRGNEFDINDKIEANLIILFGILIFVLGGKLKIYYFDRLLKNLPEVKKLNFFYYILFFSLSFLIFYKWNFDLNLLLFRGFSDNIITQEIYKSVMDYQFFGRTIRPMLIILLVIFIYDYNKKKKYLSYNQKLNSLIQFIFLFILTVFLSFPFGLERSQVAILYIPLLIILTKLWEKPFMMQTTLLAAIFIIFPFLDKFRRFDGFENFSFKINYAFLKQGHFDGYQNFVRVLELDLITSGRQLLGALLFFVPRSLWETKPVGSGSFLGRLLDLEFYGIAMPFIGEGYINFGIAGSILFMFLFGVLLGNLDRVVWKLKRSNETHIFMFYYYFLFGWIFYFMRGDLINAIPVLVGFTLAFWLLVLFLNFLSRVRI